MELLNLVSVRSARHVGIVIRHGAVNYGRRDDPISLFALVQGFPGDFLADASGKPVRGVHDIDPLL